MTVTRPPLPLDGVLVVSLEQAIAAPLATRHLADWGARVIKVERPEAGDFCRDYDTVMSGLSCQFVWTNRSKESLALDLKDQRGRDALERLLGKADVFVQNLAPGAAERLGLDAQSLTERFPRLIACDVSGYGKNGPLSDKKAYDLLVQCEAAVLAVNGSEDHPAKAGISIVDIATGMYILNGVLMALYERSRTGRGLAFEVSLFDAITEWMSYPAYYTHGSGRPFRRSGMRHATIAPYGPFRTGNGKVVFFGIQNDREWQSFCSSVLGEAAIATDPRFATPSARLENRDALEALIEQSFARLTDREVMERLDRAAIANANLNSVEDFLAHPQLHARGRVRDVASPAGPVMSFLPAVTIPGREPVMGAVPALGQHSAAILAELGYADLTEPD